MNDMIELCVKFEMPTGRSGRLDDSLYMDDVGEGPFCEDCYDEEANK